MGTLDLAGAVTCLKHCFNLFTDNNAALPVMRKKKKQIRMYRVFKRWAVNVKELMETCIFYI